MTSRQRIATTLLLGLVIFIGSVILFHGTTFSQMPSPDSPLSTRASYWKAFLLKNGVDSGLASAHEQLLTLGPVTNHAQGHGIGEALFDIEGPNAIQHCTYEDFNAGCIHAIVAHAIELNGVGAARDLFNNCASHQDSTPGFTITRCLHSIGHGLLAYFGYTPAAVTQALSACPGAALDVLWGCHSGVFMEFFLHSVSTTSAPLTVSDANRWQPCNEVPSSYRAQCIFSRVRWWSEQTPNFQTIAFTEKYADLARTCDSSPTPWEKHVCYGGIGYAAITQYGNQFQAITAACDAAGTNPTAHHLCRICAYTFAIRAFLARDTSSILCDGLKGNDATNCRAAACTNSFISSSMR